MNTFSSVVSRGPYDSCKWLAAKPGLPSTPCHDSVPALLQADTHPGSSDQQLHQGISAECMQRHTEANTPP